MPRRSGTWLTAIARLRLLIASVVLVSLGFTKEGHTSGGGHITITRDLVRVTLTTSRKMPEPEYAAAYAEEVARWEAATRPQAEKVARAIERAVRPRQRAALRLVPGRFDAPGLGALSSEGIVTTDVADAAGWALTVPLDGLIEGDVAITATFVLAARPRKDAARALAEQARAAARRALGLPPAARPRYTTLWLTPDAGSPALLLTTVPVAQLAAALAATPWRPMGFETFRRAPALLLETSGKAFVTRNAAEFLVANPTNARFDAAAGTLSLQVNGGWLPAMRVTPAPRAEALRLLASPVDPALDPAAAAQARARLQDDIDFLASLRPALAGAR